MKRVLCWLLIALLGATAFLGLHGARLQPAWGQADSTATPLSDIAELSNTSINRQQAGEWQEARESIEKACQELLGLPAPTDAACLQLQTQPLAFNNTELQLAARLLNTRARLSLHLGDPEAANATWQRAAELYTLVNDPEGMAGAKFNQAQALQRLGQHREALQILAALQQSLDQQPNSHLKALQLLSLGNAFRAVGDLDRAKNALKAAENTKALTGEEVSDLNLSFGNLYWALGDRDRLPRIPSPSLTAAGCVVKPKQSSNPEDDPEDKRTDWTEETAKYYKDALERYGSVYTPGSSTALSLQAGLQKLRLLIQLRDIFNPHQRSADLEEINTVKTNLSRTIDSLPDLKLRITSQLNLAQSLICLYRDNLQDNRGQIENLQDNRGQIENLLSITLLHVDAKTQAFIIGKLGILYEELANETQNSNDLEKAEYYTREAISLARSLNADEILFPLYWQWGRLMRKDGKRDAAIQAYTQAIDLSQALRYHLTGIGAGFWATPASPADSPNTGSEGSGEIDFFRTEDVSLATFQNRYPNPTLAPRPIDTDIRFYFRDNAEPIYREFMDLLLEEVNPSNAAQKQDVLYKVLGVRELLEVTELENFLECDLSTNGYSSIGRSVKTTAEIVAQKLKEIYGSEDKVDLIVPIILRNQTAAILFHKGVLYANRLDKSNELETSLEQLYNYIGTPSRDFLVKKQSSLVYDQIIRPFEDVEDENLLDDVEVLTFLLDDQLRNIPVTAWYDEVKEEYLLFKDYSTAIIPSLQLLVSAEESNITFSGLLGGLTKGNNAPEGVAEQFRIVSDSIPVVTPLTDENFTSETIQKELSSKVFQVVHFATHGQFSSNSLSNDTYIQAYNRERIGVERLRQLLYTGNEPIQLLVFSACQTATGDRRATLGLAGIAIRAGAVRTLATLWNITTKPNPGEMFGKFYKAIADKTIPAKALQIAQQEFYKLTEDPYVWSPYVLVGNWR